MGERTLLILGGGCAGLSLAMRLAEAPLPFDKVILLEQRTNYTHDRTWCFWDHPTNGCQDLVHQHWARLKITHAGDHAEMLCPQAPYQMIRAEDFYTAALQRIASNPKFALRLGVSVQAVMSQADVWAVTTNQGMFLGHTLVDTRPPVAGTAAPILWQSFYGQEIVCEADVFGPDCVELMNFFPPSQQGVAFTYVLPWSTRVALVETTVFGPQSLTQQDLAMRQAEAVRTHTRHNPFGVRRAEQGILPMGLPAKPRHNKPNFAEAGLFAGGARASTGYAFQRIQHWASVCAGSLQAGQGPVGHLKDPWHVRAMDHLFLHVLRARPDLAPMLFLRLFKTLPPETLVRFLSDRGSLADGLAVVRALPPKPFLQALWNTGPSFRVSHP